MGKCGQGGIEGCSGLGSWIAEFRTCVLQTSDERAAIVLRNCRGSKELQKMQCVGKKVTEMS